MILGEMINFAKKVACIQFTFYGAFIQFTLTLYGPVKSPYLDFKYHDTAETSEHSSHRSEKIVLGSLLRKYRTKSSFCSCIKTDFSVQLKC